MTSRMTDQASALVTPSSGNKGLAKHLDSRRKSRLELHQAHCDICGSELQDEIDEAFVNWDCVSQIAKDYRLHRSALYRHAHATGLLERRNRNIRHALGHIIQHAGRVDVTADSIIRAVKIFTHINAHGSWAQPPTYIIHSSAPSTPARAELSGTPPHLIDQPNP